MTDRNAFIAADLGAESGRVMLGTLADGALNLREVHRFPNRPCRAGGTLHWDVLSLFAEIKKGLQKACREAPETPAGIGVDTWGVDFGLLDARGELMGNPVHYRDARTNGVFEKAFEIVARREIYSRTGIQFLQFNSIFQLLAMRLAGSAQLQTAGELLMMPDLLNFWLTGRKAREFTNATTTQAFDTMKGDWAWGLIDAFGLPRQIFGEITTPGRMLGPIQRSVTDELAIPPIPVFLPATHDTGSAVAAVPGEGEDWAYISCGTWALVGMETSKPVINEQALGYNFTNEGGVFGTNRLLANVMGLWLLQRAKASWEASGRALNYSEIVGLAEKARPFCGWLDVDDPAFFNPADMVAAIGDFGARTKQAFPNDIGAVIRIVLESLALKYRFKLEQVQALTGRPVRVIHIVGGGSRNELLCQMTADACNCRVIAGPAEATAMGNVLVQASAAGLLKGLADIRATVRHSSDLKVFDPSPAPKWDQMHERLVSHLKQQA